MDIFSWIMNTVDGANEWEQVYCKIPDGDKGRIPAQLPTFGDHENLANRSIGHAMGPLVETLIAGYALDSKEAKIILSLFRHYLIARQLHDDAHDWADDLLRGRVNSVGAIVIKKSQCEMQGQSRPLITDAIPGLRKTFWEVAIDTVVSLICRHIGAARDARKRSTLIGNGYFMEEDLAALEASAIRTLNERDDALLFLKHYHPPRI